MSDTLDLLRRPGRADRRAGGCAQRVRGGGGDRGPRGAVAAPPRPPPGDHPIGQRGAGADERSGRTARVVLAGHLDTVPINDNLPSRREGDDPARLRHRRHEGRRRGHAAHRGHCARTRRHDLTFVFYDCEEIEAERNGLGRIERELPEWLTGDLAIVCEPSNGTVEAGCQGTMRIELRTTGKRAHTAGRWMGENAIHGARRGAAQAGGLRGAASSTSTAARTARACRP